MTKALPMLKLRNNGGKILRSSNEGVGGVLTTVMNVNSRLSLHGSALAFSTCFQSFILAVSLEF
jgi:hypothetical protein